jgi:hypothetical protein
MFGQPDYSLRVLVADHEEYEALTVNKLGRLPALHRLVSHYDAPRAGVAGSKTDP